MRYVLPLFLIFLTSCATLPRAIRIQSSAGGERNQRIHVASHGWHTGIILERENLNKRIPSLADRFPDSNYYEIGWGDAGYYQANKITAEITWNAIFMPSDTVIHLVGLTDHPVKYFDNSEVREVLISADDMESLCTFVESSFLRDESGRPVMLGKGLYGDSQFYEAQGKYHLFNGCNKWTAKALYSGGVEIDPFFKLTSASVMHEIGLPARSFKKQILHR